MTSTLQSHSFSFHPWEAMLFHFFTAVTTLLLENALTFKHIPSDIPNSLLDIYSWSSITREQKLFLIQEHPFR